MKQKKDMLKQSSQCDYEPCIVSFIDVLGFRNLINECSAGEIHDIVKKLQLFTKPDEERAPRSMDEVRLTSRAFAHSISDSVIRIRPYDTQYRDGAFVWELLDLLYAQISLINAGVLIRAGLAIGDAYVGYNGEGPAFGPAIVRAYEIESQEAVFPRIVIDDQAIASHKNNEKLRAEQNTLESETEMVNKILAIGDDGTRFIDYLSADDAFDEPEDYLTFLQNHASLIREGRNKYTNSRVRRKYEWLARYHNSKVSNLRISILHSEESRRDFLSEYGACPESFLDEITIALD